MGKFKIAILHEGEHLNLREVGQIFGMSGAATYAMYKRGFDTVPKMIEYRAKLAANPSKGGGAEPKVYDTSEGKMTAQQCEEHHKYGLTAGTIRYRAMVWGWDHKCLWLDRQPPQLFKGAAMALDGEPRGVQSWRLTASSSPNTSDPTIPDQGISRLKTCFKDKGRERCKHYPKRLAMYAGVPWMCKAATLSSCKNYDGEILTVRTDCSGRPARQFAHSGAPMT